MESNQPVYPSPSPTPASGGNERIMAIASLVLGILNLCAWFFPICGIRSIVAHLSVPCRLRRDGESKCPRLRKRGVDELLLCDADPLIASHVRGPVGRAKLKHRSTMGKDQEHP